MRHSLTQAFVESFSKPRNGKHRETGWDSKLPGFGLRVTANGARSWVAMYRHHGRLRMMTLGTYPTTPLADARDQGRKALAAAQRGEDPAAEKQANRAAGTWEELCKRYLAEYARLKCRPRTVQEYTKLINAELLPAWGHWKAKDVKRAEVKALIGKIRARKADVQANRTISLISGICNFGIKEEILESNPATLIDQTPETSQDRVLSPDEIRAVWGALGDDEPQGPWMKLLLLTGQRSGEVAEMAWSEIDFDEAIWTIPGERTKNKLAHRVPLVGQALAILRDLPRAGERVFAHSAHSARGKAADRVRKASGITFTPHHLRHTLKTGLARLRVNQIVSEKVLNHSAGSRGSKIAAIYDHYDYDTEKREALMLWDEHIAHILKGGARVIEFPAAESESA